MTIKIPHSLIYQPNLSFKKKRTHLKNTKKEIITFNNFNAKDSFKKSWIVSWVSLNKTATWECQLNSLNFIKVLVWSLLKTFLNNKKIPLTPPLYHQGDFVTSFKQKAELFISFFGRNFSLIQNDSKLPSHLHCKTDKRLLTANNYISKLLQSLDPNIAHGHDRISFRMLQLCVNSICKTLELIFKQEKKRM